MAKRMSRVIEGRKEGRKSTGEVGRGGIEVLRGIGWRDDGGRPKEEENCWGDCISSAQLKALQQTDGRDRDGK